MSLTFYAPVGKEAATIVGTAFCAGCGGHLVYRARALLPGPAAFYGVHLQTRALFDQCVAEGREYYYIDNGYFRRGHYGGFFRVTRNANQHDGSGRHRSTRFDRLGLTVAPWRGDEGAGAAVVIVALQSNWWYGRHGTTRREWLAKVSRQIARATGRVVVLRNKPVGAQRRGQPPLAADLARAWCVVTYSSNVAVDAILAGVPAFVAARCAAWPMASSDLSQIEAPRRPAGRRQWAWNLAANQWRLDEMRDGTCWRGVRG